MSPVVKNINHNEYIFNHRGSQSYQRVAQSCKSVIIRYEQNIIFIFNFDGINDLLNAKQQ